jgi:hypothetical protein
MLAAQLLMAMFAWPIPSLARFATCLARGLTTSSVRDATSMTFAVPFL